VYTDEFQQHAVGAANVADHRDRRGLSSTKICRLGCVQEVLKNNIIEIFCFVLPSTCFCYASNLIYVNKNFELIFDAYFSKPLAIKQAKLG
jgi:hypothetical protein